MECSFYDVGCQFDWLIDEINLLFIQFYQWVILGFADMLSSIPAPDFLSNIGTAQLGLTDQVLFFATLFELQTGVEIITGAYIARFLVRRLPVIG